MDFLVEFEICVPPDYDPERFAELVKRERARAAEIAAHQLLQDGLDRAVSEGADLHLHGRRREGAA